MAIPMVEDIPYSMMKIPIQVGSCVAGVTAVGMLLAGKMPAGFSWSGMEDFNGQLTDAQDIKDALEILVARTLPPKTQWHASNVRWGVDYANKIAAITYCTHPVAGKSVYYAAAMKW